VVREDRVTDERLHPNRCALPLRPAWAGPWLDRDERDSRALAPESRLGLAPRPSRTCGVALDEVHPPRSPALRSFARLDPSCPMDSHLQVSETPVQTDAVLPPGTTHSGPQIAPTFPCPAAPCDYGWEIFPRGAPPTLTHSLWRWRERGLAPRTTR
jgi:hypothetical protein